MKISKQELAQVIKEELNALTEGDDWYSDEHETLADKKFADSQADKASDFKAHMDKFGGDYDDPIDAAKYRVGYLIGKFGSNPDVLEVLEDIADLLRKAKPNLPAIKEGGFRLDKTYKDSPGMMAAEFVDALKLHGVDKAVAEGSGEVFIKPGRGGGYTLEMVGKGKGFFENEDS